MFKGNKKYIYLFCGIFALIILIQYLLPKPVNWTRTYQSKDKSPFGTYAIKNLLKNVYAENVEENKKTFYNLNSENGDSSSLIVINDRLDLNKNDVKALFQLLEKGKTILLCANEFGGKFSDSLHIKTEYSSFTYFNSFDSLLKKPGEEISFLPKNQSRSYVYPQAFWTSYFTNYDTSLFKIQAVTMRDKACLLKGKFGKGTLLLMSAPDVFTNYFIVKHENRQLAYSILSLVKNKTIVWDEYYKTYNVSHYSFMKFILESDALYSAYLLLIFSIIAYMITEGRRRQRAIPILEPVTNTTLEFVNVISHVYFNSKNHKHIAEERIKFFYESVRKKFGVNTNDLNDQLVNDICVLSGIDQKQVKQLFTYCERIKQQNELSELELIELNRQISNFNKNSLR